MLTGQWKNESSMCQDRESVTERRQNRLDFKHGAIKAQEECQESSENLPLPFW
jgi:hypothetical protein